MSRSEALRQLCLGSLIAGLSFSAAASTQATQALPSPAAVSDHGVVTLEQSGIYIVQLAEPPVAQYRGEFAGLPAVKRDAERGNRFDAKSSEAKAYVEHLQARQDDFLADLASAAKSSSEPAEVLGRFHHAFNGLTLKLSTEQLAAVKAHPSVRLIEPLTAYPILSDDGPRFIGAPGLWDGSANGGAGSRGEGVVIGVIDSGVNWPHPSFAAQDGDGYNHINPNGAGIYFGICDASDPGNPAPNPELGPACNDKLIGAWDMAFDLVQQINADCAVATPPSFCAQLGTPLTDFDNALDENGHGSHTAGTAGGNRIDTGFLANDLSISGVAPRANLVVYDTCHTNVNGQGSCLNFATLAAINQAVIDGVDVINYSIGGGLQPWNEAGALAFLAAADAGIVVAASAGNSGPTASTVGHLEPWVMTVASGTHERGTFGALSFSMTGPGTPPADIVAQPILIGTVGILWTPALPPGTPLIVSPGIDTATDGCNVAPDPFAPNEFMGTNPFAPDQFLGAAALIRRGSCSFSEKILNAQAAGAIAMIIANNQPTDIAPGPTPGAAQVDIPGFLLSQVRADAVRDFVAGLGDPSEAAISIQGVVNPRAGDVMSGFSSRGPSNLEMIKPDVMGPGSNILAAYVGGPTAVNAISGTSMSSPHLAGAAALLRALKPSWTPMEIKSALMMTAKSSGILKENGATPADPFDTGAGRVDLSVAARAGLVMDEVQANFQAANPALGGDVSSLNTASLKSFNCIGSCSFTRTVRNTLGESQDYVFDTTTPAGISISVEPNGFTIPAGGTQELTITVSADSGTAAMGVWNFAELRLQPSVLRGAGITALEENFDDATFPPTGWSVHKLAGGGTATWIRDTAQSNSAPASARRFYGGSGDGNQDDWLVSPAFTVPPNGVVSLVDRGEFMVDYVYQAVKLSTGSCNPADAEFVELREMGDALDVTWRNPAIEISLAAFTGQQACLAFHYTGVFANTWWIDDVAVVGSVPQPPPVLHLPVAVRPFAALPVIGVAPTAISESAAFGAPAFDVPLTVSNTGNVDLNWAVDSSGECGAPWFSVDPAADVVVPSGSSSVEVTINPSGLAIGDHVAKICLDSDDPATPVLEIPVTLEVIALDDEIFFDGFEAEPPRPAAAAR